MYSPGYLPPAPTLYWPYQFIREVNFNTGGATTLVYDGKNSIGYEYDASLPTPAFNSLPANNVLTDATAMAMQTGSTRLYFVNKPISGVPADLCYYGTNPGVNSGNPSAFRLKNQPLTTNTTSLITRMTMDTQGQGYAITDDGLEFIRFTADATSVTVTKRGALVDDISNGSNSVLLENGGDIVCDGSGNLILITFAGKVYKINNAANDNVATWVYSIPNFPSTGCQSVAIGPDGTFIIGGRYLNVYKYTLSTNAFTQLTATGGFASIDFASCTMPPKPARVAVNETPTAPLNAEVSARVLPNPFKKELNLQVQLTTAENVKVRLVDFYGRTVYTTTRQMGAGTNSLNLSVPGNLSAGIYVVDIWAGNNHLLQKKLVKQ
ncbi:T9SS type A sorting domain-containing protein [Niastella koreensis]|nr:T9SS type A sorting domain-containing protein [Niastella koreensis]